MQSPMANFNITKGKKQRSEISYDREVEGLKCTVDAIVLMLYVATM